MGNGPSKNEIEQGNPKRRLETEIAMLPTASARDWKGKRNGAARGFGADINDIVENNGTKTGLKLQPDFVAWMMGYPAGWATLPSASPDTVKSS
jgi:hypothetical protein